MNKPTNTLKRSDQDRRQNHMPFYKLIFSKGRRRNIRRTEDCNRITELDQYQLSLFISVLIVLGLSLMDAALTLMLLDRGAVELNPVMRYYINHGPTIFILVKYGITALALMIMVSLSAIISVRYKFISLLMFPFCVLVFGIVIVWELYLLANTPPI